MLKKDIPLDQAVALVRACQKLNCDTADQLFAMVERHCKEAADEMKRADTNYARATRAEEKLRRYNM